MGLGKFSAGLEISVSQIGVSESRARKKLKRVSEFESCILKFESRQTKRKLSLN